MISEAGVPLLSDFGISRMLSSSDSLHFTSTLTGGVRGTIRFMSSELLWEFDFSSEAQTEAPGVSLDAYTKASDVWAFGMTVLVRELFLENISIQRMFITLF